MGKVAIGEAIKEATSTRIMQHKRSPHAILYYTVRTTTLPNNFMLHTYYMLLLYHTIMHTLAEIGSARGRALFGVNASAATLAAAPPCYL